MKLSKRYSYVRSYFVETFLIFLKTSDHQFIWKYLGGFVLNLSTNIHKMLFHKKNLMLKDFSELYFFQIFIQCKLLYLFIP
jgi:hypothetical protein